MGTPAPREAIPDETALRLCEEILAENRDKWWTVNGLWCRGCVRFSGGDPGKRCWANVPGNRGCTQVNERYHRDVQGRV